MDNFPLAMWKEAFKESFKFLFDNPAVFLALLGNYVLLFMFGPLIGVVAGWFIATLYLAGLHGSGRSDTLLDDIKRFAKWGFIVAVILYLLFFFEGLLSYIVYNTLVYRFHLSVEGLLLFTPLWALVLALILHGPYIVLFSSTGWEDFKKNLKRIKELYTTPWGIKTLLLLWGFMLLTLLAGLVKFLHFTVGLFAVIATFWLTYYTFLGVKFFKTYALKQQEGRI